MDILIVLSGALVGFIVGLTGIGGGALMTPILVMGFGIAPIVAVSTDLLYASTTKAGGLYHYYKASLIEWCIVGRMLLGSIPGSLLMLWWIKQISNPDVLSSLINDVLGIALVITAIVVVFRSKIIEWAQNLISGSAIATMAQLRTTAVTVMGFMLGLLVTLSSVGAGALGTAALVLMFPTLSLPRIIATDLAHAVVLTSVAGLGHYQLGNIDWQLLGLLLIGSLPSVWIGSYIGARYKLKLLQPILATLLMLLGLRFIFS